MNMNKKNDPMLTNNAIELNEEELAAIVGGAGEENDHFLFDHHHDRWSRFHHHQSHHEHHGPRFPWNNEHNRSDWREPYRGR